MSRRGRGGYTVAELLVVIVILSLLSAIAVASIASYSASLSAKRLDSAAEELFLYAQNRLSYAHTYGSDDFGSIRENGEVSYILAGEGYDSGIASYSVLSAMGGKSALIELDLSTGDILAVFFSETLSAEELEGAVASLENRSAEMLAKHRFGYYDGTDRSISPREYAFVPDIRVVNENELRIEITCDNIPDVLTSDFSVRLTLSSGFFSIEEYLTDLVVKDGVLTAESLIDSISPDGGSYYMKRYGTLLGVNDIKAKAVIYCHGFGITSARTAERRSVSFNPLYEAKIGNEIRISNLRHLNNLRFLSDSSEISVIQTRDIRFDGNSIESTAIRFLPLPDFNGRYDGRNNCIYGLRIDGDSLEYVGLFSEISGEVSGIHIVGSEGYRLTLNSNAAAMGAICGKLNSGGVISNCSVSDMAFEYAIESGGIYVGGIVGVSEGVVTRCSSCADISLSAPNSASAGVGGLIGFIKSGRVEYSHSAGRLAVDRSDGESAVAGIALGDGGSILNCFSECSAGYISGADYYGISSPEVERSGCYFVYENAWLDDPSDGGIAYDDLSDLAIEGFERAEKTVASEDQNCNLPESVRRFGIPTRFGNTGLAEPRGLVGILMAEYSGGEYRRELLASFDAYGNDSAILPDIKWNDPTENEVRYYFFVNSFASPGEGEDAGWNCVFSNESVYLDEPMNIETFIFRRVCNVFDGDTATLRFADQVRTVEVALPSETVSDGLIGVVSIVYHARAISLDPVTWLPVEVPEYYDYSYCYIDPSDGTVNIYYRYSPSPALQIPELEMFKFEPNYDMEIRIYAFSSEELAPYVGSLWNFVSSFSDSPPDDVGSVSGYRYYEVYRGGGFSGQPNVSFVYSGSELAKISFYCSYGINGPEISIIETKS